MLRWLGITGMGLLAMLLIACAEESGEGPQAIVKTVVQTVEVGGEPPATGGTAISTPAAEEPKAVGETDTAGPLDVTLNGVRWDSYEAVPALAITSKAAAWSRLSWWT